MNESLLESGLHSVVSCSRFKFCGIGRSSLLPCSLLSQVRCVERGTASSFVAFSLSPSPSRYVVFYCWKSSIMWLFADWLSLSFGGFNMLHFVSYVTSSSSSGIEPKGHHLSFSSVVYVSRYLSLSHCFLYSFSLYVESASRCLHSLQVLTALHFSWLYYFRRVTSIKNNL